MERFGSTDPKEFQDKNLQSKRTRDNTKFAVRILRDFLNVRGNPDDFDLLEVDSSGVCKILEDFYSNIRTKSGEYYKKSSLLNIRQGLNRYFKENGKRFDILSDADFHSANTIFKSMLRKIRQEGKGTVTHHEAISVGDLRKLYTHPLVFNINTPQGLLNKVLFEIVFYFCRRGQENLADLLVTDFEVKQNSDGQKYVQKTKSELTKNHQGISSENEGTGGKMFATGMEKCPVFSFEKYLSKRSQKSFRLFQHPKNTFLDMDEVWYRNEPIGINTVKHFMKKLSKSAALSKEYMNHCIRATTITLLNHCGFESRHIATISGHRNEASLSSYCYDTSELQKQMMSEVLSASTSSGSQNTLPVEILSKDKEHVKDPQHPMQRPGKPIPPSVLKQIPVSKSSMDQDQLSPLQNQSSMVSRCQVTDPQHPMQRPGKPIPLSVLKQIPVSKSSMDQDQLSPLQNQSSMVSRCQVTDPQHQMQRHGKPIPPAALMQVPVSKSSVGQLSPLQNQSSIVSRYQVTGSIEQSGKGATDFLTLDDVDLDLPDELLLEYTQSLEQSLNMTIQQQNPQKQNLIFSNCNVTINYN